MDGGCFGDGGRNKESVAEEEVLAGMAENGETDGEKGRSGGGRRYSATEAGWRTPGGGDSDGSRETEKKRGRAGEGGGHGGRGGGRGSSDEGEGSSDGGKVSAKREIGRRLCFAEEEREREIEREREREEVELLGGGAGGRRPTVGNDGVKCGREDETRK